MKMLGNHNMHYRNISMIIIMIFTIIMIGNYYIQLADKMPTINAYDKPVGVSVSGGEYLLGDMKYGYLRWRSVGCDFEHVQVSDYEYNDGITKIKAQ